jgi:hypothetical protein
MSRAIRGMTGVWNGPVAMTTCRAVTVPVDVSAQNVSPVLVSRVTRVFRRTGNSNAAA